MKAVQLRNAGLTPLDSQAYVRLIKLWETLKHPNILPLVAFHINPELGILQWATMFAEAGNISQHLHAINPNATTRLRLVRLFPIFRSNVPSVLTPNVTL